MPRAVVFGPADGHVGVVTVIARLLCLVSLAIFLAGTLAHPAVAALMVIGPALAQDEGSGMDACPACDDAEAADAACDMTCSLAFATIVAEKSDLRMPRSPTLRGTLGAFLTVLAGPPDHSPPRTPFLS